MLPFFSSFRFPRTFSRSVYTLPVYYSVDWSLYFSPYRLLFARTCDRIVFVSTVPVEWKSTALSPCMKCINKCMYMYVYSSQLRRTSGEEWLNAHRTPTDGWRHRWLLDTDRGGTKSSAPRVKLFPTTTLSALLYCGEISRVRLETNEG